MLAFQAIVSGALAGFLSLAHCAAMCGPLSAAACAGQRGGLGPLRYQLGRVLSYAFAGSLAARVGQLLDHTSLVAVSPLVLGLCGALALAVLAFSALRPRASMPQLVQLTRRAKPSPFASLLRLMPREPLVYGGLSVLLPCGALAAALLLAAATTSPLQGALLMLSFAATSGVAVLAGGFLLSRFTALGGRLMPRALLVLMIAAATFVGLRPLYRAHASDREQAQAVSHADTPTTSAEPSCH